MSFVGEEPSGVDAPVEGPTPILQITAFGLSANAPEFIPGQKWTPPPSPELPLLSPFPELRTCSDSEKNDPKSGPELKEDLENAAVESKDPGDRLASVESGENQEQEAKEPSPDGGNWTMATASNRRHRSKKNSGSKANPDNQQRIRDDRNWPGEYVNIDKFRRYVVWSVEVQAARNAIAQNRFALVLMRGVPGSGKTTLAKMLKKNGMICGTDDYFFRDGLYQFDPSRLEDAHTWNLQRAVQAFTSRISPVVVDNTNIHLWEMTRYVKAAARNEYDVYFIEPDTPWKANAQECFRRNTHGVPLQVIERMITSLEPVVSLASFMEAGLLRHQISPPGASMHQESTRRVNSTPDVSVQSATVALDFLRSSSSTEVKQNAEKRASPADSWESSEPALAWTTEEATPSPCAPKEQRPAHQLSNSNAVDLAAPMVDAKKPVVLSPRRKRPGGCSGILLNSFTSGAWQLPSDLIGGLASAASSDDGSNSSNAIANSASNADLKSVCEIHVRNAVVHVTEKHLALANLNHRRLGRPVADTLDVDMEERTVIKSNGSGAVIKCDTSVQCDSDSGTLALHDSTTAEPWQHMAKAKEMLRDCFPQVDDEDLEEIFLRCDCQLTWAVNVLLDSGYDVDWTTRQKPAAAETDADDKNNVRWVESEELSADSDGSKSDSAKDGGVDESPLIDSVYSGDDREKNSCIEESFDSDSPLYAMEMSLDMAAQLQRIFTPIFPDIPPALLSPSQMRFCVPHHLLAEIYRCWLKSQTSEGFSERDSDFCSDGSLSDEFPVESQSTRKSKALDESQGDDDVLAVERQIWMDEQFARQLASEEEQTTVEEADDTRSQPATAELLATKIKLKRLYELFPTVDRNMLKSVFNSNNFHLDKTIAMLCGTYDYDVPKLGRAGSSSPARTHSTRATQKQTTSSDESYVSSEFEKFSYEELRQEAWVHLRERQANFQKAQEYFRRGMASVAYYYAQRGQLHNGKFKEANEWAAKKIMQQRRAANPAWVLDLHGLHVNEAIQALVDLLHEYENRSGKELKIITGQGIHSSNGPKIKPAVLNYLRQHRHNVTELTPGVLIVTIK